MRRKFLPLLPVLVLVLFAGCFKVEQQMTISDDGLVSGTMVAAMNKDALEAMASFSEELDPGSVDHRELWDELQAESGALDLPPGATREPYEEGDHIGDTYTFQDVPLDVFVTWMNEDSDDEFSIEHVDGTYVLRATVDMTDMTGMDDEEMGFDEEMDPFGGEMDQFFALFGEPTYLMSITFPGEVLEHNGELDGTTVTWEPDLTTGETFVLEAVAKDSGGASGGGGADTGETGGTGEGDTAGNPDQDASGDKEGSGDDSSSWPVILVAASGGLAALALIGLLIVLLRSRRRA